MVLQSQCHRGDDDDDFVLLISRYETDDYVSVHAGGLDVLTVRLVFCVSEEE